MIEYLNTVRGVILVSSVTWNTYIALYSIILYLFYLNIWFKTSFINGRKNVIALNLFD
jgi:hypothetical protein